MVVAVVEAVVEAAEEVQQPQEQPQEEEEIRNSSERNHPPLAEIDKTSTDSYQTFLDIYP